MTLRWCSQFFLTVLKDKHQLYGCQNLFRSLFLKDFQPNLVKLVQDFFAVPASSKNICCSFVLREAVGASASYSPHSCHVPNILKLLIWHFQADDSYTRPTQNWGGLSILKAVHKWAIWWSRRMILWFYGCASHKKQEQSWLSKP